MSFDIETVAGGEYDKALPIATLRAWARKSGVDIGPERRGMTMLYVANLDGCGGIHKTKDGALHLLYHQIHNVNESDGE